MHAKTFTEFLTTLKLDSHVAEGFCQTKLFASVVRKNTNISLVSCFLYEHADLHLSATSCINDYL